MKAEDAKRGNVLVHMIQRTASEVKAIEDQLRRAEHDVPEMMCVEFGHPFGVRVNVPWDEAVALVEKLLIQRRADLKRLQDELEAL